MAEGFTWGHPQPAAGQGCVFPAFQSLAALRPLLHPDPCAEVQPASGQVYLDMSGDRTLHERWGGGGQGVWWAPLTPAKAERRLGGKTQEMTTKKYCPPEVER